MRHKIKAVIFSIFIVVLTTFISGNWAEAFTVAILPDSRGGLTLKNELINPALTMLDFDVKQGSPADPNFFDGVDVFVYINGQGPSVFNLTAAEQDALIDFIQNGGNAYIALEPLSTDPSNFAENFALRLGFIVSASSNGTTTGAVTDLSHPINGPFQPAGPFNLSVFGEFDPPLPPGGSFIGNETGFTGGEPGQGEEVLAFLAVGSPVEGSGSSGKIYIYSDIAALRSAPVLFKNALLNMGAPLLDPECTPPPAGLTSWWKAEGNAGDEQNDNPGTISGAVAFVPGKVGQAFDFDGTGFVRVPHDPSLQPQQITIDGWIRPKFAGRPAQVADADTVFEKLDSGSRGYFLGVAMDPNFIFDQAPGPVPLGTPVFFLIVNGTPHQIFGASPLPNDGLYHHVAATYDGAAMRLFVDGVEVASRVVSGPISHSDSDAFIGRENAFPRNSRASIDEVEIFSRALSKSEIETIVLAGRAGKCTPSGVNHFLSYALVKDDDDDSDSDSGGMQLQVDLTDQFDSGSFRVKGPVALLNPVEKKVGDEVTPVDDTETHLVGYVISAAGKDGDDESSDDDSGGSVIKRMVQVTNQFGELFLNTLKADRLLVPSLKDLQTPIPDADLPESFSVDHFQCYGVEPTKGKPKFQALEVTLTDQFNEPDGKKFIVKKPTRLCNPVEKNIAGVITEIQNPENHLLCYAVKRAKGEPRHKRIKGVHVNNQFGALELDTRTEKELCLPSEKTFLGEVPPGDDDDSS